MFLQGLPDEELESEYQYIHQVFDYHTRRLHYLLIRCLDGKRSFVMTEHDGYGIAPFLVEIGDIICQVNGVPNTMVIRRQPLGTFKVIGPILLEYANNRDVGSGNQGWERVELS